VIFIAVDGEVVARAATLSGNCPDSLTTQPMKSCAQSADKLRSLMMQSGNQPVPGDWRVVVVLGLSQDDVYYAVFVHFEEVAEK